MIRPFTVTVHKCDCLMAIRNFQSIIPPSLELAGGGEIYRFSDAVDSLARRIRCEKTGWLTTRRVGRAAWRRNQWGARSCPLLESGLPADK